jgi:hypothetical protein
VRLRLDPNFATAYPEQTGDIDEKVETKNLVPTETVLVIVVEDSRVVAKAKMCLKQVGTMGLKMGFETSSEYPPLHV